MFRLNNNLPPNLTRNSEASCIKISRAWFVTRDVLLVSSKRLVIFLVADGRDRRVRV